MSTSTTDNYRLSPTKSPQVLVRAFGGEPVPLRAAEAHGGVVEVVGKGGARIGVPLAEVFQFDEDVFSSLSAAYQAGSQTELQSLWSQATPFDSDELKRANYH